MSSPLDALASWPVDRAAGAVVGPGGSLDAAGDTGWPTRIASVTKPLVAYACLVALEEGTLALDRAAGPPGSTVRHLLAHASGLPFEGSEPIARPGERRIYSNTGFERLGEALASAADMSAATYLAEAVLRPLGMGETELRGSPAKDGWSTVDDLARFAAELLEPTLVAPGTLDEATSEQFPGPGRGGARARQLRPQSLGAGIRAQGQQVAALDGTRRVRRARSATSAGPARSCGSIPTPRLACVVLTDREFGDWAPPLWSSLSSAVLMEHSQP